MQNSDNNEKTVSASLSNRGAMTSFRYGLQNMDLVPILQNLYIDPEKFLKPIKSVEISYDEQQ